MKAFGYDKNDEEFEKILKLGQVTLSRKREDLENIIKFLNTVKNESENETLEDKDHWHYRDYESSWKEEETDLIIFIEN